jgi:hypothetical protein
MFATLEFPRPLTVDGGNVVKSRRKPSCVRDSAGGKVRRDTIRRAEEGRRRWRARSDNTQTLHRRISCRQGTTGSAAQAEM